MSQRDPQKQDNAKPLPKSLRAVRATVRGQEPPSSATTENEKDSSKNLFPVAAAAEKEKQKAEREAARQRARDAMIGTEIKDETGKSKGIYLGTHEIRDRDNKLIGEFNLYAAPKNLEKRNFIGKKTLQFKFNQAVEHVDDLKNYYGYNGFDHFILGKSAENVLFEALDKGRYDGEWFIPTREMLDLLHQKKNKGALKGTFDTNHLPTSRYWSCTENADAPFFLSSHDFSNDILSWMGKEDRQSVRLVRAEPVEKPATSAPRPGGGNKVTY